MNIDTTRMSHNRRWQYILLLIIVANLPFFVSLSSILILGLLAMWLVEGGFKSKWQIFSSRPLNWLFLAFFMVHFLSLIYSQTDAGLPIVERRLSLLAFPVILGSAHFTKKQIRNICLGLVAGILLASLITIGNGAYIAIQSGDSNSLFYHDLVAILDESAIYISCLTTFSILVLLFYGTQQWKEFSVAYKWTYTGLLLWLLLFLVLLSSKIFLFIAFLSINIYFFYLFKQKKGGQAALKIVGFNLLLILLIIILPHTRERIERIMDSEMETVTRENYDYTTDFNGLTLRLVFWRIAVDILNEKNAWLAGVGVGDAQNELNQKYREYELYTGNPELGDIGYLNYNTHSQYVQLFLELGILGLINWLLILLIPMIRAIQRRSMLVCLFLLVMAIFGLTEVFLDRQMGIIFFSIFYCLLILSDKSGSRLKESK